MSKVLAFIPARSGSKGVKNKNIRDLAGKPLIAYTVEEAIKSNIFEDVIVSTDSQKIAEIARSYDAIVPFLRPKELAADESPTIDAIFHCLNYMKNNAKEYDVIMLLQPTSPLRKDYHIKEAYKLFNEKQADFTVSVCECEHSPLWTNVIHEDLKMDYFIREEVKNLRRQDLPQYYRLNGAIYIAKINKLYSDKSFFGKNSFAYIMDPEYSIDIDSEIDLQLCEVLINNKENYI